MQKSTNFVHKSTCNNMLNIFALAESLCSQSYNMKLLQAATKICSPMHINIFTQLAHIPMFNEDMETKPDCILQTVLTMRQQVHAADAVLIATPEYNQSIPGALKNALDWLSRSDAESSVPENKPVAILGVAVGSWTLVSPKRIYVTS